MSKKIVFMGTPRFSVRTLEILAKSSFEVVCVYTQPPKKSSRGQKINSSPIQQAAEKLDLQVKVPINLHQEKEYEYFKMLNPDIVIVVAYGNIIPKNYFKLSKKGFINIHASLLPKLRGAAPIQRSIINLEKETGISIMRIEEELDTGPYMMQDKVLIDSQTNTEILGDKLAELGAINIIECINLIFKNEAKFIKQNHKNATYAKKIKKEEARILWAEDARHVLAKINAFNPTPGAWFEYEKTRYKIWKAEIAEVSGLPGKILDENMIIACKKNSIKIVEIQKEGKARLSLNEFLKGSKIPKNFILS
jgi:methionyl-tRNA formyltransferase